MNKINKAKLYGLLRMVYDRQENGGYKPPEFLNVDCDTPPDGEVLYVHIDKRFALRLDWDLGDNINIMSTIPDCDVLRLQTILTDWQSNERASIAREECDSIGRMSKILADYTPQGDTT